MLEGDEARSSTLPTMIDTPLSLLSSTLASFLLLLQLKLLLPRLYSVPSKEINHAIDLDGEPSLQPIIF